MTEQKLTRRRLMAITAAGAATAAGVATLGIAPSASAADAATHSNSRQLADTVLAAFRRHRIVAIGEVHGQQEHHDALQTLLLDPRLPAVVDDIVVESGNALYQPTIDRFVAGPAVEDRDLRLVWRNTTQSPVATLDAPMYEQFFRTVRAANWSLPEKRKIRVLLGDPPIDWARVTTRDDVEAADRDGHLASVVQREVLDKGRRALICYGSVHVMHAPPGAQGGGGIAQIEQQTGHRAYVILAGGHPRLALHPRRTVIPAKGTWLESADTGEFNYLPGECGLPVGAVADAVLYLGQVGEQTQSHWNPAIYLDPAYWTELQRRKAIMDSPTDLEQQYLQIQATAVRAGNGRDDRQAQPGAGLGTGPVGGDSLERLSEPADKLRIEDHPACIGDQLRRIVLGPGCDTDPATVLVVDDRVVDHVVRHAGQQGRAARGPRGVVRLDLDGQVLCLDGSATGGHGLGHQGAQRDRGGVGEGAVLRAGEHQEALQKTIDLVELDAKPAGQGERLPRRRLGFGLGHVQ
jgi:hypothetical protein